MKEVVTEKVIKDSITESELVVEQTWLEFTNGEKAAIILHFPRNKIYKEIMNRSHRLDEIKDLSSLPIVDETEIEDLEKSSEKVFEDVFNELKSAFFAEAQIFCNLYFWREYESQGRTRHRDDLQDMTKAFKAAMKQLQRIYELKTTIPSVREICLNMEQLTEIIVARIATQETVEKAFTAYNLLRGLCIVIDNFRGETLGRGGPGRVEPQTALAIGLADSYYRNFHVMPSLYNEFPGLFDCIMQIVTKDQKSRDRTRAIRKAIKTLQTKIHPSE